jgi:hypothetical protein
MATIITGLSWEIGQPADTLQKDPMSDRLPSGDRTKENVFPTASRYFRSHAMLLWQKHSSKERNVTLGGFAPWLVLIGVEFINGTLRTIFLAPRVGDFQARQIGVFTGTFLILVVAYCLSDGFTQTTANPSSMLVFYGLR